MRDSRFLLTRILLNKDGNVDSVLVRGTAAHWKPVYSHILCSVAAVAVEGIIESFLLF